MVGLAQATAKLWVGASCLRQPAELTALLLPLYRTNTLCVHNKLLWHASALVSDQTRLHSVFLPMCW